MTVCVPCDHNREHGWWGPDLPKGTHCSDCHRSWTALAEQHCAICHLHFGKSDRAWAAHFDGIRHRTLGEVRVLTTETGKPRFKVIDRASGPVLVEYNEQAHPFAAVTS